MPRKLEEVSAIDWQYQFETRAFNARDWLVGETEGMSLESRREIVQDIKEGMEEATFHQDIAYGATQIHHALIHDLWNNIKGKPRQTRKIQQKIADLAIWTATQAPAHKNAIQEMFKKIVPEDVPEKDKRMQVRCLSPFDGCCLDEHGYD